MNSTPNDSLSAEAAGYIAVAAAEKAACGWVTINGRHILIADDGGTSFVPGSREAHNVTVQNVLEKGLANARAGDKPISVERRVTYRKLFNDTVNKMSDAAMARLASHLKEVRFYPGLTELTEAARIRFNEAYSTVIDADATVGGWWDNGMDEGILHLDGSDDRMNPAASGLDRPGIYAHELTHAVDGFWGQRPSESREWIFAVNHDKAVSRYGATNYVEAFAEFGRMMHIMPHLAADYPRSLEVWRNLGLVSPAAEKAIRLEQMGRTANDVKGKFLQALPDNYPVSVVGKARVWPPQAA